MSTGHNVANYLGMDGGRVLRLRGCLRRIQHTQDTLEWRFPCCSALGVCASRWGMGKAHNAGRTAQVRCEMARHEGKGATVQGCSSGPRCHSMHSTVHIGLYYRPLSPVGAATGGGTVGGGQREG